MTYNCFFFFVVVHNKEFQRNFRHRKKGRVATARREIRREFRLVVQDLILHDPCLLILFHASVLYFKAWIKSHKHVISCHD